MIEPSPQPTITAASYERVSTVVQAKYGFSLGAQEKDAYLVAAEHNWTLPDHLRFMDGINRNASGADWDLEGLTAMMLSAKRQEFQVLIVPDVDRLARSVTKAVVLEHELKRYGVRVVYARVQVEDTPEGRLLKHELFSIAEYDRKKRALLTARTRREKAILGMYVGNGRSPYGYTYVYRTQSAWSKNGKIIGVAVVDTEAVAIRQLFTMARTKSMAKILRWLDNAGILSPGQSRGIRQAATGWTHNTLYSILRNPLYAGRAQWGGLEIPVPPIIDQALFDEVEHALSGRKNHPTGWTSRQADGEDPYTVRGRLMCGRCSRPGREVYLRTEAMAGRDRRYYICRNKFDSRIDRVESLLEKCPLPSLRAELIESYVWSVVNELFDDADEFRARLAESQARRRRDEARNVDRVEAIQAAIDQQRNRLHRCIKRLNALDPDDAEDHEEIAVQQRDCDAARKLLANLRGEHHDWKACLSGDGIDDEAADQLAGLRDELAKGLAVASANVQARVFQLLNLRATLWPDDGDVQVQIKPVRTVRFEPTAVVRLDTGSAS